MSKDEDNQNLPVSQVLRRIEELGWRVDIFSQETNDYAIINLTKGSQGFDLWIQDYGTNGDAKDGLAKGMMGYPFGAVFGRFLVRSPTEVDFNSFLPFFDFCCPDEKREKKETSLPPPPPIEVSQPDQDRMKRQIEELKEIKEKYDKGEITKEEFEAKSVSRYFDLMGGSVGEQLTKNIEKMQHAEDATRVPEFMRARVKVVGGSIKVEEADANAERVRSAQEKLAESWRGVNPMELFMTEAGGKILAEKMKENIAVSKELADAAKAGMAKKPKDDSKQCKKK